MQQGVIQRLATETGCLHKHAEVLHHFILSAEILKAQGAKGILKVLVLHRTLFSYVKIFLHILLFYSFTINLPSAVMPSQEMYISWHEELLKNSTVALPSASVFTSGSQKSVRR